jgi:hypothetical protein
MIVSLSRRGARDGNPGDSSASLSRRRSPKKAPMGDREAWRMPNRRRIV